MAWRLTGKREYFDRCVRELDAACELPDWNSSHFLDVAEMATAIGLGIDWLYADLSPPQRERYGEALRVKAIEPAREQLAKKTHSTTVHNNWSQVCGAGIAIACAAGATDPPARLAGHAITTTADDNAATTCRCSGCSARFVSESSDRAISTGSPRRAASCLCRG
jgi:hypothetical protein